MTKGVWLPNETDYSYCEFVAPNTRYCPGMASRDRLIADKWALINDITGSASLVASLNKTAVSDS